MQWEILHVPGKPPSPLEQSTVDVIASTIEPRLANKLVRQLNQVYPLENLRHVKRVRRRTIEGKVELSVIVCLSQDHVNHAEDLPNDVVQLINIYQLSTFNAKVAKYAATSKEEWEEQCKLWPTSYHPPNNNLDGIGGFSEEDSRSIFNYMKDAIRLTRSNHLGDKILNAALIVDPLSMQIIASGSDQTCVGSTSASKTSLSCIPCSEQTKTVASLQSDANGLENNDRYSLPKSSSRFANDDENSPPKSLPDERGLYCASVACLHPWAWTEYSPFMQNSGKCGSNYSWHPLRHAALVAIENAAARDRQLFPGFESLEGKSCQEDDLHHPSNGIPAKRLKIHISDNERSLGNEVCTDLLPSESMRPYLCTGFDIYLVWEPCTMCAMALVHQRIRRIFYAFPNPNAGALGSVYRLQGEKSLNHHYSVFRIMLPENVLYDARLNFSDESFIKR